ncbi:MAG: hypothetical protein AB1611_19530 [bacterium]
MDNTFLYKEYELSFEQLRFYDNRQMDLLKYLFTLTSSVATAQFAIYEFLKSPTKGFFLCQTFLSSVVFIASMLLYLSMIQNRLYFVFTARQLNALRKFFLETEATDFKSNELYTSVDFPAISPSSVHTFQLLGASFLSALFGAISVYSLSQALQQYPCWWLIAGSFVLISGAEIASGVTYLVCVGSKPADIAVHGSMIRPQGSG